MLIKYSVVKGLEDLFQVQGLKVAKQRYFHQVNGRQLAGENVYAMLRAPRADATEAIVLMAAWKNMDDVLNQSGVALVLTLARYFSRTSLPSHPSLLLLKAHRMVFLVQGHLLRHNARQHCRTASMGRCLPLYS